MGTSLEDGWRESSRPELLAVCRLQRAADDRPARAGHPNPFLVCSAVQVTAVAVLIKEGDQAGEEVAQLARIGVWHCEGEPRAGEMASSTSMSG